MAGMGVVGDLFGAANVPAPGGEVARGDEKKRWPT